MRRWLLQNGQPAAPQIQSTRACTSMESVSLWLHRTQKRGHIPLATLTCISIDARPREREREREREKFINNQIDDWRSVSTTPLVGDTAAGHSWLSIVEKESVRARERAIEQEQEEEEEEEEQEERERKERGLSRHLMWNWPCYIKSIIFFVSECWNESLRHSDSLSPSISLLPLEAEAPSWGRNDAIGVRGGKSSKCPCILCTERALLHWRHAL